MGRNLGHVIVLVLLAMTIVCVSPFASYANTSPDPPGFCVSVVNDVSHCFTENIMIRAEQGVSNTGNTAAIATNTVPMIGTDGANYTYTDMATTARGAPNHYNATSTDFKMRNAENVAGTVSNANNHAAYELRV